MSKTILSQRSKSAMNVMGFLIFSLFATVDGYAAVHMGPIAGNSVMGKKLDVQATVSGMPTDVSSQMRSHCLSATVSPVGVQGLDFEVKKQTLQVFYDPTIEGGGTVRFKSDFPVSDPVVEVNLVSQCPLLSFQKSWTVLLQGVAVPLTSNGGSVQKVSMASSSSGNQITEFNVSGSSLLEASRIVPQKMASRSISHKLETKKAEESALAKAKAEQEELLAKAQAPAVVESDVRNEQYASAKDSISQFQMIQSPTRSKTMVDFVDPQKAIAQAASPVMSSGFEMPVYLYFVGFGALLFLIGGGGYWVLHRRPKPSYTPRQAPSSSPVLQRHLPEEHHEDFSAFGSSVVTMDDLQEQESSFEADTSSSKNLFQSFLGVPTEELDMDTGAMDDRPRFDGREDSDELVASTMGVLNRVEPKAWVLPEGYAEIVAHRNQSIQSRKTSDAMILRFSLGFIELSFQHALLSTELTDSSLERLTAGLGSYDLDSEEDMFSETVPDILHAYVQAKLCELDGQEKRGFFIQNMTSLADFCKSMPLCFKSTAWKEFMFELGAEA